MVPLNKDVILLLADVTDDMFAEVMDIAPKMDVIRGSRDMRPDEALLPRVKVVFGYAKRLFDQMMENTSFRPDWLQIRSAGFDRLNTDAMLDRGIVVTNVRGIHGIQMTETLFGMLLSRARQLGAATLNQKAAVWKDDYTYEEITGRSMAIIGAGAIARETAGVARYGFRMKVVGVTRRGLKDEAFDETLPIERWKEAVKDADIVVNLLPLNRSTHHFFDRDAFSAMKQGAWFANLGRGGTVDTDALIDALDAGSIAFAALDVYEVEPLESDSPLWKRHDVMLTPHIAGLSVFYDERAFDVFTRNLRAYIKDGAPSLNIVDLTS
jgi:D-2-hydroxyacid dehydrogenase (NADP+)